MRLRQDCIRDLVKITQKVQHRSLTRVQLQRYCNGVEPKNPCVQTYGLYNADRELIAIATATYAYTYPTIEYPNGKSCMVSGIAVLEDYDYDTCMNQLVDEIEIDATTFGADKIIYENNGGLE